MPKRTVYVRDGDERLWKRAEELSGNMSAALAEALEDYIAKKEAEMQATNPHGRIVYEGLSVWQSADPGRSEIGQEFDTKGTGPVQAQQLVDRLKVQPGVRYVALEERRRYEDGTFVRTPLQEWHLTAGGWIRVKLRT